MQDPIVLTWQGKDYPIPTRRVMEIILAVEDIVTLGQLARATQANDPPLGRIARAYATVLRMLDVRVEDIDVYRSMFGAGADMAPIAAINALLTLLVPPDALVARRGTSEGNAPAPHAGAATTSSSRPRRSRRPSATSGAAPLNSGA